eukprot:c19447_g1_i1.p1 GENE.c19447_g1_i1~~c19447_g1_i1.p1  ORF type:complete len:385 (+),score=161.03 c19447_g1_i1:36-1190(+)
MTSAIPRFFQLSINERQEKICQNSSLTNADIDLLQKKDDPKIVEIADKMVENVIGILPLPLLSLDNININNQSLNVPLCLNNYDLSLIQSKISKVSFNAKATRPIMIGQIQLLNCENPQTIVSSILTPENKEKIKNEVAKFSGSLPSHGGGFIDVECHLVSSLRGEMVIFHILVDVCDAMGANAINRICEGVAPFIQQLASTYSPNCHVGFKILSNLCKHRRVLVEATWSKESLQTTEQSGKEIIDNILDIFELISFDKNLSLLHNSFIMKAVNGILLATTNDTRAVESSVYSYQSVFAESMCLTQLSQLEDGSLYAKIDLPIAVGVIGGSIQTHPIAKQSLSTLKNPNSRQFSEIIASVALAAGITHIYSLIPKSQNFSSPKL